MYQLIDTFRAVGVSGESHYFVTLSRPGRQRWTRVAFYSAYDAIVYGARVAARYTRIFGGENGREKVA